MDGGFALSRIPARLPPT